MVQVSAMLLQNNLYIDPLTKLPNFFSFIEGNLNEIFESKGCVVIFDMENFKNFNVEYGSVNGDVILKYLSESIQEVINVHEEIHVFRTYGDEFTLICKNMEFDYCEIIAKHIKDNYKVKMENNELIKKEKKDFSDFGIHTFIMRYEEEISSVEKFYELLLNNSIIKHKNYEEKFSTSNLFKNIVGGILNRVRDTISYYNSAYDLAITDDVSGLLNHRAGRLYLNNLLEEINYNNKFSVFFIDGDNLKRYNGISYEEGNKMIRNLSEIIKSSIRIEDKVYRWLSGDEFLVVVKNTDEERTMKLAERIRHSVEEQTKEWIYPITVSIGVVVYPEDGIHLDEIINRAEKANSDAKKSGKNKVVKWIAC